MWFIIFLKQEGGGKNRKISSSIKKDTKEQSERIFDVIDIGYIDFIFRISNNAIGVDLWPQTSLYSPVNVFILPNQWGRSVFRWGQNV